MAVGRYEQTRCRAGMSANNWRHCPECSQNRTDPIRAAQKLYGQVSAEEYEQGMEDARNADPQEESLREDYEFILEGFSLSISYGCTCQDCGFTFSFDKQINVKPNKEKTNDRE